MSYNKIISIGIIFLIIIAILPGLLIFEIIIDTTLAQESDEPELNFVTFYKTFGGQENENGNSVQQTSDGGYIIAGETSSYGVGNEDLWLIKTDIFGNEQWNKTFGGSKPDFGKSIKQTNDGGYIITGFTESYGNDEDVWLIKTDTNGTEEWNKTYEEGNNHDRGYSVQQTLDGGYIITGYIFIKSQDLPEGHDWNILLIKTDDLGNKEWTRIFGGKEYDVGYSVQQTSDDGYVICGSTNSYSKRGRDIWLIKINNSGFEEWNRTYDRSQSDHGRSIQQTTDSGYIITGSTTNPGGYDVWLIKTDDSGNELWNKTFGRHLIEEGMFARETLDGGYIITGNSCSYDVFETDIWLIKTDNLGNVKWNRTFGGIDNENSFAVQLTSDEGFVIIGNTESFGTGKYDLWLIKTDNLGRIVTYNPPIPRFTVNKYVAIPGEEIFFNASESYDIDGDIVEYIWDFEDGSKGSGITISHSYSKLIDYKVTLIVIDNHGLEDIVSKRIFIVELDGDKDDDGVPNQLDPQPYYYVDSDGDGLSDHFEDFYDGDAYTSEPWPLGNDLNKTNKDTDNDGYSDDIDEYPIDPTKWFDTDGDGYYDNNDTFPFDPTEWLDNDDDGTGNNADPDDDNDGLSDIEEGTLGTDPLLADTDGDGYNDNIDDYPLDSTKWEKEESDGDYEDNTMLYVGIGIVVIILIIILILLFIFLKNEKISSEQPPTTPKVTPPQPQPPVRPSPEPAPPEPPYSTLPNKYLRNINTKEIHEYGKMVNSCKLDQIKEKHKFWLKTEMEVKDYCSNKGYNGCKWCLPKYHED